LRPFKVAAKEITFEKQLLMRNSFAFFALLFLTFLCAAQTTESNLDSKPVRFFTVYPEHSYLEDLDEFAKTLTETHPYPYEFTTKEKFWRTVEEKKELINDKTTFSEFMWHCSEIMANLGCSHSSLGWFNQEDSILPISLRFPMELRLVENRLYISDPLINRDKLKAGAEIFSINGISVELIKDEAYRHMNSQAHIETYKTILFNAYVTSYIPYVLGFPKDYEIIVREHNESIQLKNLENYQVKPRYDRITSGGPCQKDLCLEILEDSNIGVLTIKNFAYYGDEFPIFKSFIKESFEEINSRKPTDLIIDLRFNGGGPSHAGAFFLQHIFKEPFNYYPNGIKYHDDLTEALQPVENSFKDKIYILMDGDGQSTTGHVLSLVKEKNRATLIGEELASNQFCTGNQKRNLKLANTGISYQVAQTAFETTVKGFPRDRGIMPDHYIVQSIHDFLNNRDTVMEYAIQLIKVQ